MPPKKVYNIKPIGIVFSTSPEASTFTTLNGEEFKRTKNLEFLAEVKPKPPLNLEERVQKALFNRDYNIDLVRYEIIEKAKPKGKRKTKKKTTKKKG